MTDKEVIKVLEYIADKVGIAVDWTAENVLPYAKEVMNECVLLKIISSAVGVVISGAMLLVAVFLFRWWCKDYYKCKETKKTTFLWEYTYYCSLKEESFACNGIGAAVIIASPVIAFFSFIFFVVFLSELLQWSIAPEMSLAKEILYILKAV